MGKASYKLRSLGDVAAVIARSPSVTAAAQALGVDRGTVHRWIRAGKAPAPGSMRPRARLPPRVRYAWRCRSTCCSTVRGRAQMTLSRIGSGWQAVKRSPG